MREFHYFDKLFSSGYYLKLFLRGLWEPKRIINRTQVYLSSFHAKAFIVSYPKTGRTWLRVMLGKAIALKYQINDTMVLDTFRITKRAGLVPTVFSHDGPFLLRDSSPYYELRFNKKLYKDKKVIFLVRDIRDTLVSSYFEESKRTKVYKGNLGEFIRDNRFGIKKIVAFYNLWFNHQEIPKEFLLIRYEDMHKKPVEILESVVKFLNAGDVEKEILEEAVSFGSFDHMKKMEKENVFGDSMLLPGLQKDVDSYKVRRGKIGGFIDYLTIEDLDYIDKVVSKMGIRDCDWYYMPKNG